jgi:hypothetical protein
MARGLVAIALLAVALFSSLSSAEAARLPQWGRCLPAAAGAGGHYSDPGCIVKAHGKAGDAIRYEWSELPAGMRAQLMPMTATGPVTFQTSAGKKIECSVLGGESFARAEGPAAVATPLWELERCTSEAQECHSNQAALLGEVNNLYSWLEEPEERGEPSPGWAGRLGFISRGGDPPGVGIAYTVKNHERMFEPVSCKGPIGIVWIGGESRSRNSFTASIAPVDTMTTELTETLSQTSPGVQAPARLERHAPQGISAFLENHWEPVAVTASFHYEIEGGGHAIEIKATP